MAFLAERIPVQTDTDPCNRVDPYPAQDLAALPGDQVARWPSGLGPCPESLCASTASCSPCRSPLWRQAVDGFSIAEPHGQCDKGKMTQQSVSRTQPGKASWAWTLLLSLLLVSVSAHSRLAGISLQPALASLAATHGVESPAILTSATKLLRAADLRLSGDPDAAAFACAPPVPTLNLIITTALWAPAVSGASCAHSRPEPRAPPFA